MFSIRLKDSCQILSHEQTMSQILLFLNQILEHLKNRLSIVVHMQLKVQIAKEYMRQEYEILVHMSLGNQQQIAAWQQCLCELLLMNQIDNISNQDLHLLDGHQSLLALASIVKEALGLLDMAECLLVEG